MRIVSKIKSTIAVYAGDEAPCVIGQKIHFTRILDFDVKSQCLILEGVGSPKPKAVPIGDTELLVELDFKKVFPPEPEPEPEPEPVLLLGLP